MAAAPKTSEASSGSGAAPAPAPAPAPADPKAPASIPDLIHHMRMQEMTKMNEKATHKFWAKQPVPKLGEAPLESANEPIEVKSVDDVRKKPYKLPKGYSWSVVNPHLDAELKELYDLLANNYVEDSDAMFRFNYKQSFLKWALSPPHSFGDWMVGVRFDETNELCAFISGIPVTTSIKGAEMRMCEINFLCVHKRLREKRLAPVLIKEITRRVNRRDIWQAVYTAGIVVPSPVAGCRYYHRNLNCRKLLDIGFTRLGPRMTKMRFERLYALPDEPTIPGWRRMTKADAPAVTALVNAYVSRFDLHLHFTEAELRHWLLPRDGVVTSYVVEAQEDTADTAAGDGGDAEAAAASSSESAGESSSSSSSSASASSSSADERLAWDPDMTVPNSKGVPIRAVASFYHLPSSVLRHEKHSELLAGYSYYNVPAGGISLASLMKNLLIAAKAEGMDVFNALHLMDNESIFKELRFGPGDGTLNYYLYNWRCARLPPSQVGIVLL